jgi:hypothetical protein
MGVSPMITVLVLGGIAVLAMMCYIGQPPNVAQKALPTYSAVKSRHNFTPH